MCEITKKSAGIRNSSPVVAQRGRKLAVAPHGPYSRAMPFSPYDPGETRSSVLAAIRDPANATAWERFFDQYAPFVHALALRRGLRREDAEDVVQTVLVEVAGKIRSFAYDRARGRFHDWLAEAARFRINDLLRQNARREGRELPLAGTAPDLAVPVDAFAEAAEAEWLAHLRRCALERLRDRVPRRQFELFHAAVVAEWPTEKIVRTYGASRAAVYQAKHRVTPLYQDILREIRSELDSPPAIPPSGSPP